MYKTLFIIDSFLCFGLNFIYSVIEISCKTLCGYPGIYEILCEDFGDICPKHWGIWQNVICNTVLKVMSNFFELERKDI